jgi:hypothetical protein
LLGAQFPLRGAAFDDPKIKITTHKQDEAFGACRLGRLSANQKAKLMRSNDNFWPFPPSDNGSRQDAGADIVHSSSKTIMDIPTSAGLVRITTTITTTVVIINAADARDDPSVDCGIWQPAAPLTLPSPTKRRKR